jgi:hypothetical protein
MYFEVKSGDNRKENLDDLELHLIVTLRDAVANGFYNGINEHPGKAAVHIGCGSLVIWVYTVVLSITVQEFVRNELLNDVQQTLHKLCNLSVQAKLKDIEILVGIIWSILLEFNFLYTSL